MSESKLEKGQFRIDLNLSFTKGKKFFPYQEIKNLNSLKNVRLAFLKIKKIRNSLDSNDEELITKKNNFNFLR